ncbi:hypothetical protein T08_13330 [Trichinella sp. T8]|nr:hypothetical protein T08_13330 [Trichinella sp. T8]
MNSTLWPYYTKHLGKPPAKLSKQLMQLETGRTEHSH